MKIRSFLVTLCGVAVCGCATRPIQENDGVPIAAVTRRVQCEVALATQELGTPEGGWATSMNLTLKVDTHGNVAPSVTALGIYHSGVYAVNVHGGLTGKTIRTALINLTMAITKEDIDECQETSLHYLAGDLGLRDWIQRAVSNDAEGYKFKSEKGIGYTLEFEIEASIGVSPILRFEHSERSLGVGLGQKRIHSLDLALVPIPPIPMPSRPVPSQIKKPKPTDEMARPMRSPETAREGSAPQPTAPRRAAPQRTRNIPDDVRRRLNTILQDLNFQKLQRR
jgi:hypothetical protein